MVGCEFCDGAGGEILWQDECCRVVLPADTDYPGFCRIILNQHVREMTDLEPSARERLLRVVLAAEEALRCALRPDKINLASLGNRVPHLHWHVIPRFVDDRHFPNPIWGEPMRTGVRRDTPRAAITAALHERLARWNPCSNSYD